MSEVLRSGGAWDGILFGMETGRGVLGSPIRVH